MYHVQVSNEQVIELISNSINNLMEENRDNFEKNKQIMTPMSSQIAVMATLQVLNQLGLITIEEPSKN